MIKKNYRNVLLNLSGGVAVLHVGAATEMEMKEKKDRVDDAFMQQELQLKKVLFLVVV